MSRWAEFRAALEQELVAHAPLYALALAVGAWTTLLTLIFVVVGWP